jgi:carbon-monoxide dehydrogenase medium subunit
VDGDAEGRCGVIPEAFDYELAGSVEEALRLLGAGGVPLAGGHSLIPALKLRLSEPETLVDIARIPELKGIRVDGSTLVIGATTRHHDVATSSDVAAHATALAQAAAGIGDQMVRNRGTIGGSVANADPHGDLPATMLALGAEIVVRGPAGERRVAADDFFVDYYTTSLAAGELVTSIRIPGGQSRGAYIKFNRRTLDWALVGVAVSQGAAGWRIGLTGVAPTALRAKGAEQALAQGASFADAAAHAAEGLEPPEGLDGSAEYKRHLATVLVRRALEAAG